MMWWLVVVMVVVVGRGRGEGSRDSSSSLLATVGCDGRTGKKELLDMSVALLHAHRQGNSISSEDGSIFIINK